jgi:hypothetical protein
MAFLPPQKEVQFADLKGVLSQSRAIDPALYQTIQILLERLDQLKTSHDEVINNINNSVNTIIDNTSTTIVTGGTTASADLDYLGDYSSTTRSVYNDGDIVIGTDDIAYMCVKDGTTTPPEAWPGGSGGIVTASPHHTTHETGGTDAITSLSGAVITSGTINDARLSSNIPLKDASNVFTATQLVPSLLVKHANNPRVAWRDDSQGVDAKTFEARNNAGVLYISAVNDAQSAVVNDAFKIDRNGTCWIGNAIYEGGRSTPIGYWQTGNCSSYLPAIGLSGPIRWSLVGKTLTIIFIMSGVLSAGRASISLTIPGFSSDASLVGFIGAGLMCSTTSKTWHTGVLAIASATVIDLYDELTVAWPAGQVYINGTVIIAIP